MTGHAEIAGGGFTGLTMGTALAQAGWTVRVHERSPEIRAFGAGIWIWDNGVRVLKAIGAADAALEGCTEAPTYISRDARGRFIDEVPFAPVTSTERSRMFCITRQQLLSAMLGAAERAGVEIVTSSTAQAARPDGTLLTEDGRTWPADLAIAADGINSRVRDSLGLLKSRKPHVDGAIRVLVPHEPGYADTEEGRTIREWWNGHRRVLYTPCNSEVFYLAFTMLARDEEASRLPLPRALWTEAFPHLRSMIERVPDEGRYDRFETIKLKAWSAGRVAVVGDSAHAMSPGLGQGCGTAISNALSLANMLRDSGDDIEGCSRALGGAPAADLRAHPALVDRHLAAHSLAPLGGAALLQHAGAASLDAEAAAQAVRVLRLRHRGPGALDAAPPARLSGRRRQARRRARSTQANAAMSRMASLSIRCLA